MRLFKGFSSPLELPWSFSYIIRKRQQIDNFNEMPKDKRPPEIMIWWGKPEEVEKWLEEVYDYKKNKQGDGVNMAFSPDEIE